MALIGHHSLKIFWEILFCRSKMFNFMAPKSRRENESENNVRDSTFLYKRNSPDEELLYKVQPYITPLVWMQYCCWWIIIRSINFIGEF